jgi:type IV secretory pathway component VirB8
MYKYNYLFDADQNQVYAASREAVTIEMVERWVKEAENYTPTTLADALRKKALEMNEERRKLLERFFNKRGSHPIQANFELAD